jgi:CheY-like chemotaxis protein
VPLRCLAVAGEIGPDDTVGGVLTEARIPEDRGLVLLVDDDVASRRQARHLLELQGLEVVQASNGIAALELIQRLPRSFRLVLTELELPGISGPAVVETLRLFRPDLPVLCMSVPAGAGIQGNRRCLPKPLSAQDLAAAMQAGAGAWSPEGVSHVAEACVARARARYAMAGDLVEAALELARAMRDAEDV